MIVRFEHCDPREVAAILQQLPDGITHLPEVDPIQTRAADSPVTVEILIDVAKIVGYVLAAWVARTALRLGPSTQIYLDGHQTRDESELHQRLEYYQAQQQQNDRHQIP